MKKTHFFKKVFCFILTFTMLLSAMPIWSISSSALQKGSQTFSLSGNNNTVKVRLEMFNATYVSGNTVTYVVDRAFYKDMSELGNIYNAFFEVNGVSVKTNITTTDYSLSNYGNRDQFVTTNNKKNNFVSDNSAGFISGAIPEAGQTKQFTVTASISDNYYIYFNGYDLYPSDSTSASATVVVKAIDTTQIQNELKECELLRESCWTATTWSRLQGALTNAQNVANNPNSSQAEISASASSLNYAREGLVHNGLISTCEFCCSGGGSSSVTAPDCYYNVSYGSAGVRNTYDLYLPSNTSGDVSMILYIHGGAWIYGSKEDFTGDAYKSCAQFGIATASVNYRYTSFGSVNAWNILDDIQSAVAHIKQFAANKGLNITKMMIYGFSAGGHISLLYGYTRKDVSAITPVCIFDKSGPAYLANPQYLKESSSMAPLLSCISGFYFEEEYAAYATPALLDVSPYTYVNSNSIPTVINHGVVDSIVPYTDSVYLDNKLSQYGVEHEFNTFPNSNHGLESDPDMSVKMNDSFMRYVSKYLLDTVPVQNHTYVASVKAATCTQEGYTKYVCTDCGKYYLSDFVAPTHTNGPVVKENVVPATCSSKGSFQDVVYCTLCHAEVSRISFESEQLAHTLGKWETATPATFENAGLKIQKCTVCKQIINSEEIAKLEQPKIEVKNEFENVKIDSQNGIIAGIEQGETDLNKLFNMTNCTLEYVQTQAGFGTGSSVKVKSILGDEIATYTVVIYGDVTGDGYADAFDVSNLSEYINNFDEPSGIAFKKSVDIVEDGFLDATDLAYLISIANFE